MECSPRSIGLDFFLFCNRLHSLGLLLHEMFFFSFYRRKTIIFPSLKWMQQDSSNLTPQQWGVKDPKTPAICRGLHSSSRIRTRRHTTHTFNPHFFYCEEKNIFYVTNLNAPIYRPLQNPPCPLVGPPPLCPKFCDENSVSDVWKRAVMKYA